VADETHETEEDNVYRLPRGVPTLIIARSSLDIARYRPRWIRNAEGCVEALGYESDPPSPRPLVAIQRSFITSLILKNNKVGDRVIWKRRLQDNHIHGTDTITLVARQPPLIHLLTRVAYNHFCYEIDSAALKEPGIEGQVSENLIRSLIPSAGSWRGYVESLGSPRQGFSLEKRSLSPEAPSSSAVPSARNDGPPKSNHQRIAKGKDLANEKRRNLSNRFEKKEMEGDWSDDVSVQKQRERSISIGPRRGGGQFKPLIGSSDENWEYGTEERLIKEKGLSAGPKKWYAHEKEATRINSRTPYEPKAMEGSSSVSNKEECDFK
jgi:hypothetical protein